MRGGHALRPASGVGIGLRVLLVVVWRGDARGERGESARVGVELGPL
jgi:hypothetical protein